MTQAGKLALARSPMRVKFGQTSGKQAWASGILYRLYERLPSSGEYQKILVSQPVTALLSWHVQNGGLIRSLSYHTLHDIYDLFCYTYKSSKCFLQDLDYLLINDMWNMLQIVLQIRKHCQQYWHLCPFYAQDKYSPLTKQLVMGLPAMLRQQYTLGYTATERSSLWLPSH